MIKVWTPGMVEASICGDVMKLQIKVNDDGSLKTLKFKTYGCGSVNRYHQVY